MTDLVHSVETQPVYQLSSPPLARPLASSDGQLPAAHRPISFQRTEGYAIASAACGLVPVVPVVSQALGLGLGVVSLIRLRRARQAGLPLKGKVWAVIGLVFNGLALLGWIALAGLYWYLSTTVANSAESLRSLTGLSQ